VCSSDLHLVDGVAGDRVAAGLRDGLAAIEIEIAIGAAGEEDAEGDDGEGARDAPAFSP
jgi:hypothetical protein